MIKPAKFARDDHAHRDIPFLSEEDDFPWWPLCLGVALLATGIGWLDGTLVALLGLT